MTVSKLPKLKPATSASIRKRAKLIFLEERKKRQPAFEASSIKPLINNEEIKKIRMELCKCRLNNGSLSAIVCINVAGIRARSPKSTAP